MDEITFYGLPEEREEQAKEIFNDDLSSDDDDDDEWVFFEDILEDKDLKLEEDNE